ncbi:MAG: Ig-like domain-containing protein [Gammaproteobacteria bacterium]|nr:Ig-like domain-containing protein [Gammaproteobacteria bacterium]
MRLAVGTCTRLYATAIDQDQTVRDVTSLAQWQSLNTSILALSTDKIGAVCAQAKAAGTTTIQAKFDDVQASLSLQAVANALSHIEISQDPRTQTKSAEARIMATGVFGNHHKQDLTNQIDWQLPNGVTLQNGILLAPSATAGSTISLQAQLASISASKDIVLDGAAITSLSLHIDKQQLPLATSTRLLVMGQHEDGSEFDVSPHVNWTLNSNLAAIVQVGSEVRLIAQKTGNLTITGTYQTLTVSRDLTLVASDITELQLDYAAKVAMPVGEKSGMRATASFANGLLQDVTADVVWQSLAPDIISVSNVQGQRGQLFAHKAGTAVIRAQLANQSAQYDLVAHDAALSQISLSSADYYLPEGTKTQLAALAQYANGQQWDLTEQVIWQVADSALATITNDATSSGRLSALTVSANASQVSANYLGITSQLAFRPVAAAAAGLTSIELFADQTSLPVGTTTALHALGIYSDDSKRDITHELSWSVDAPNVADIARQNQNLRLNAIAAGTVVVSAKMPGAISGSLTLQINTPTLQSLHFTSTPFTQPAGFEAAVSVVGQYNNGAQIDVSDRVTLTVGNNQIATVSYDASLQPRLRGLQIGETQLSASLASVTANQTVSVGAATLSELSIIPAQIKLSLGLGQAVQLQARFSDGSGKDVTSSAQWKTLNQSVASVSAGQAQARVTATGLGATQVVASFAGMTTQIDVETSAAVLQSIRVQPKVVTLPLGLEQTLSATGLYSDGSERDISAQIAWSVSNASIATVSNQIPGLVKTQSVGSTSVRASLGGLFDDAAITVSSATLNASGLELDVIPTTLAKGVEHQLGLFGSYTDGVRRDLTAKATWSSLDSSVLSVSNLAGSKGLLSAMALGSTTISAQVDGQTVSATITVSDAALQRLEIFALNPSLPIGLKSRFTATAYYTDSSYRTVTNQVIWSSADNQIAAPTGVPGEFVTRAAGDVAISAQLQTFHANDTISVINATLNSITIAPLNSTINTLAQQQFTATGAFSDGKNYSLTDQVVWQSSSANQEVSINSGLGGGLARSNTNTATSVTISASLASKAASTTLTVANETVSTVIVQSAQINMATSGASNIANLVTGMKLPLSALLQFPSTSATLTSGVVWSSSAPTVVSVSNLPGQEGVIRTLAAGNATITATFGGVSGTMNFSVVDDATKASEMLVWTVPNAVLVNEQVALCVAPINKNRVALLNQPFLINNLAGLAATLTGACVPNSTVKFSGIKLDALDIDGNGMLDIEVRLNSLDATLITRQNSRIVSSLDQSLGIQKSSSLLWDGSTLKSGSQFVITTANSTGRDYGLFNVEIEILDGSGNLINTVEAVSNPAILSDGVLAGNETLRLMLTLTQDYPNAKKVIVTYTMSASITDSGGTQTTSFYPVVIFDL